MLRARFRSIFIFSVMALFLSGATPIHRIRPDDAERLLAQGDIVVLDVRTAQEFQSGYIAGAKPIPMKEFPTRLRELPKDKTQPILIYCTNGARSYQAAKILRRTGYKDIYDLSG